MRFKRPAIVTAVAAAAVVAGSGIAFAVWSATGTGSGSAAATVAQNLVVTGVIPTGSYATLYPGGPASAVYFQVANPNPYAITLTGVSYGIPTSDNTVACANTNISVDTAAPATVSISIPANTPAGTTYSIPGVLDLSHAAPDGCQGVGFNVPLTLTGHQQ